MLSLQQEFAEYLVKSTLGRKELFDRETLRGFGAAFGRGVPEWSGQVNGFWWGPVIKAAKLVRLNPADNEGVPLYVTRDYYDELETAAKKTLGLRRNLEKHEVWAYVKEVVLKPAAVPTAKSPRVVTETDQMENVTSKHWMHKGHLATISSTACPVTVAMEAIQTDEKLRKVYAQIRVLTGSARDRERCTRPERVDEGMASELLMWVKPTSELTVTFDHMGVRFTITHTPKMEGTYVFFVDVIEMDKPQQR